MVSKTGRILNVFHIWKITSQRPRLLPKYGAVLPDPQQNTSFESFLINLAKVLMFLLRYSSSITSISAFATSLALIFFPISTIPLNRGKNQNYNQALHSRTTMTIFIGFHISIIYLFTTFPILAYAKTTTNPARNHNTPPQLLCLDSGFCVPKTISTPSLDLESHIRLDIMSEASLTPQLGGNMLDRNVVFAVRIAEQNVRK
jgi:hypothetical protein